MPSIHSYKIITATHRTMSVKRLKQVSVSHDDDDMTQHRLEQLKHRFGLSEIMYLNTCNRVCYAFCADQVLEDGFMAQFVAAINPELTSEDVDDIVSRISLFEGEYAVMHLFEVASSIDSLVIGEREILRQLRCAYSKSQERGLTGDAFRLLMNHTVEAAKRVYTTTRIGEKPVSVVSLSVKQLLKHNPSTQSRVLIVGAGQTNVLVSKFLQKNGFKNFAVFNRSFEKAQALATTLRGAAFSLDSLVDYAHGFDILVVCTASQEAVITKEIYAQLIGSDTGKKYIIDLAVPNDVSEEAIATYDPIYIEVEGLRELAQANLAFREAEVYAAQNVLADELARFGEVYRERQIELAMRHVPSEIKAIKKHAMESVFKRDLAELDPDTLDLVTRMMSYMEKKCISIPMTAAKQAVSGKENVKSTASRKTHRRKHVEVKR